MRILFHDQLGVTSALLPHGIDSLRLYYVGKELFFMKRTLVSVFLVALLICCLAVPTFAAEVTPVTYTDFESIITTMQGQISVSTVVAILVACVTASVGLVFMWWGARKVSGALMAAFKKGKIKI